MEEVLKLKDEIRQELVHYEFHMFGVDEDDTISLESYLKSVISCISGKKREKYLRLIQKVIKGLTEEEANTRVTYG